MRAMTSRVSFLPRSVVVVLVATALLSTACAPEDEDTTTAQPKASGSASQTVEVGA